MLIHLHRFRWLPLTISLLAATHPIWFRFLIGESILHHHLLLSAGLLLLSALLLWWFQYQVQDMDLLHSFVEQSADLAALIDRRGRIIYVNASAARATGYPAERLIGCDITELFSGYAQGLANPILSGLLVQEDPARRILHARNAQGELLILRIKSQSIQRPGGRHRLITAENITRPVQLAQSLAACFDALPSASAAIDADGHVLSCNAAFAAEVGLSVGAVIGTQTLPYQLGPLLPEAWQERLRRGERIRTEIEEPAGRSIALELSPTCDQSGALIAYFLQARDVTEEKALAEQSLKTARLAAVGQVAAGIAHNINNILGVIQLNAEFLALMTGREHAAIQAIDLAVLRGTGMVKELQAVAGGQLAPVLSPIPVRSLLATKLRLVGPQLAVQGIDAQVDAAAELQVIGDREMLRQVLLNLVKNGIQAMPNGGTLSLSAVVQGDWIELIVTDTGCGIPPEHLERLFTSFFTTKERGTGLGLVTSQRMVQAMGGEILVSSTLGAGSSFTVRLPKAPQS